MRNLFSMLGGLAVGAIAALLFAPQSGKETREKIKNLLREKMPDLSAQRLEELVDEVLNKFKAEEVENQETAANE
ncbi:MAG: YtxH domain-containing protein [Paludibacteraceae bacterium]|nr:YtxH domain-containing protein [Paludibacteraceae bacterium]